MEQPMRWRELIRALETQESGGAGDPEIADVCYDSRRAARGALFVAIPGVKAHGDTFIADAVTRGASAVVSEHAQPGCAVPWARVRDPRSALGLLGRTLWADGFEPRMMVGVTGTNGKTTTAMLLHALTVQRFGARAAWLFGTVTYEFDGKTWDASRTTPESVDIFRMVGQAAARPSSIVMEVSSHSLELQRVAGLFYDVGVFTNLTQDHLDFHPTMEAYYAAKRRLFREHLNAGGCAVVNVDDPWGRRLAGELPGVRVLTYGKAQDASVRMSAWTCSWDGVRLALAGAGGTWEIGSRLTGPFNLYNVTSFCAAAYALGFGPAQMQDALDAVRTVPGRLERVPIDAPFTAVVDYAHTPDALEKVLAAARELTTGRLITVFGCGGDRDRTKRPLMAAAVAKGCDEAVVTSDNPRSEQPQAIIDEILAGMPSGFKHAVDVDRSEAIARALRGARENDCVVVAGKGHETYQEVNGVKHPFDDREKVKELWTAIAKERAHG